MTEPKFMSELKDGPADIEFANKLFEELHGLPLEKLLERIEFRFFANVGGAIELFEKICLRASNDKARAEAAKYLMNLLKDQSIIRNFAIIHEIRLKGGKVNGGAATTDNVATWKTEPETEKK